jgi:hypothetical protein
MHTSFIDNEEFGKIVRVSQSNEWDQICNKIYRHPIVMVKYEEIGSESDEDYFEIET